MARESKVFRFSKRVILWACIFVTALAAADFILCWRAGEQMDSTAIAAVCSFWGAEMAMNAWIKVTETKTGNGKQEEPGERNR